MRSAGRKRAEAVITPRAALAALASKVARAAQRVYDDWEQDDEGLSEEYGGGGICDDVADAVCDVLRESGVAEDVTTWHVQDDNHTVALALMSDGVWEVDVPSGVYERGSWYNYRKVPDVRIGAGDVTVVRLGGRGEWDDYAGELA